MRRVAHCAVLVLSVAGAISACGGSSDNGIASKSPDAIVSAAGGAIAAVKSVHVSGSILSGGSPITLDLDLVSGKGGRGKISEGGLTFQLIGIGNVVYIGGSPAFLRHFGGALAVRLFQGKWLQVRAGTRDFASVSGLTNLHLLLNKVLSSHGKLAKGATTTVRGQQVVPITDRTKGGTLYIATTGRPYPIELRKAGAQGGHIDFDRFNESVSLKAPANSIDIAQLLG